MSNLTEERRGFEAIGNQYAAAEGVVRQAATFAGVPCTWFVPADIKFGNVVIYIHGGGFIYGSVNSHAPMVSHIAQQLKQKILFIDYRLAPEHIFPAGLNDCVAVIEAFCEEHAAVNFALMGDSAGGNLVMAAQLALKNIKAQYSMVISPWVDLECKNASYQRNATTDTVLNKPFLMSAATTYAPGHDLSTPLLSPVNGNFKGLAPVLILCGTYEILEDDAVHLHKQLLGHGVKAELKLFEKELHVWPFMDIHTKASQATLQHLSAFAEQQG